MHDFALRWFVGVKHVVGSKQNIELGYLRIHS